MRILKKLPLRRPLGRHGAGATAADQVKIALLVKKLGNGFFDAADKGAEEAAKELGNVEIIYTGPTQTTPKARSTSSIRSSRRTSTPSPFRPTTRMRWCRR